MRALRHFGLVSLLLLTPACTTSVELGQHDGGAPEPCGPVLCEVGEVCCNPSCGICTAPGAACIERSCGGRCDSFIAVGTGTCRAILGYAWNGASCTPITGCGCEGIDCERLHPDIDTCRSFHAACDGCFSDADCPPEEYCAFPMGGCGPSFGAGSCAPRPVTATCPGLYAPVCGCDGVTYPSECEANAVGISVSFPGECDACAPDDVVATGACDAVIGRFWNGMACVEVSGCACEGADCPPLLAPPEMVSCERLHEACLVPDLPCGGAACFRASEHCVLDPMGVGRCVASACTPVTCACVPEMGMCSDDGAGGVTVFVY